MKKFILFILILTVPAAIYAQEPYEGNYRKKETSKAKPEPTLTKEQQKRKNIISGEIKLETEAKAKDPYLSAEDSATKYFETLQNTVRSLASGNSQNVPLPDEDALRFITVSYLFCSVNSGVCQYFLDSLLEADLINGRINKTDDCKTLRSFWKEYIANDLENRHKYATKIGFLAETGEFNARTRPKYIKCKNTVRSLRTGSGADSEFFRARYSGGKNQQAISDTLEYIKALKTKKINVFNELSRLR